MGSEREIGSKIEDVLVTTFKGKIMKQETMNLCKVQSLDPNEVDFHLDLINRHAQVRNDEGRTKCFHGNIPHLGAVKITLLVKILKQSPRFLLPYELGLMKPRFASHWIKESCIQTIACLRKYLFEDTAKGRKVRFLLTAKPFAVAFNSERSFRLIERAYIPTEDELLEEEAKRFKQSAISPK